MNYGRNKLVKLWFWKICRTGRMVIYSGRISTCTWKYAIISLTMGYGFVLKQPTSSRISKLSEYKKKILSFDRIRVCMGCQLDNQYINFFMNCVYCKLFFCIYDLHKLKFKQYRIKHQYMEIMSEKKNFG